MSDRPSHGRLRPLLVVLVALVTLAAGPCTTLDRALGKVPWFTTMRDQVSVQPFQAPRLAPVPGTVPITGHEDSLDIYTPAGEARVNALRNPAPADSASLERGRLVYLTYCTVCHGPAGAGDGTVAGKLGYVPPLIQDMTKQRSDGYIYAVIRHGRGVMPRYGDKIRDPMDRWRVVRYVRQLQQGGGQ